jgi:hypothetical protein
MNTSPFEPEVPPRSSDRGSRQQIDDGEVRGEMRASRPDEDGDQHAGETIEEPGYGHGV